MHTEKLPKFKILDSAGNFVAEVSANSLEEAHTAFMQDTKSRLFASLKDFERWTRDINTRNLIYNKRLSPFMVLGRQFDRPKHFTNTNSPQVLANV